MNLKLNGVWNPELGNTGLQAHVDFVQKFASSAGQMLSVDPSRINVTNVRSGSIVVSFVIAEATPAETGNGTIITVMSAESALTSFRYLMSICTQDSSKCPVFNNLAALSYTELRNSLSAEEDDAEDRDGDNILQCYSSSESEGGGRCVRMPCTSDSDCQALAGLGNPTLAYCGHISGICDDGLGAAVKGEIISGGARRSAAPAFSASQLAIAMATWMIMLLDLGIILDGDVSSGSLR